jgi:hypothetical protein
MSTPAHLLFEQVTSDADDKIDDRAQIDSLSHNLHKDPYNLDYETINPYVAYVEDRPPSPSDNDDYYQQVIQPFTAAVEAQKKQQNASFWNAIATQIKLFFLSGFFVFFSKIQWKTFTATAVIHYVTLPLAPLFESIEVIANIYQIAVSRETDIKLWISLVVNIIKLIGVGLAVGLLLAGMIATNALFATVGGAAFVFALGLKTLFHAGMALYHLAKSFNSNLSKLQKSDHRHEALNHFTGGVICAALTVSSAFVMLKGFMLMAIVGAAVSFAGAIAGIGLMYKDYKRKQIEKDKIAATVAEDTIVPHRIANQYDYNYSHNFTVRESPARPAGCCPRQNPFKGFVSSLMARFSSTSPAKVSANMKKKNDDLGNISYPAPINAIKLPAANNSANIDGLIRKNKNV